VILENYLEKSKAAEALYGCTRAPD